MTLLRNRLANIPTFVFDIVIVVGIFVAGLAYYGSLYIQEEGKFSFYQKYFHAAVNIYCIKDPDVRIYNALIPEVNERLDLAKVDCREVGSSPRAVGNYFNGWHDTHPIFSTLMGYTWRWLGFNWAALWPLAGTIGALALVSFYLIPRAFGLPQLVTLLLFPACVPFALLQQHFYYLRDFSKVPFILLAFAVLGLLFKRELTSTQRLCVLSLSTGIVVVGMGFRQDSLVLLPAIAAAAILTASIEARRGALRLGIDLMAIAVSFVFFSFVLQLLKTTQTAPLQGYPHFLVQGFADPFWAEARTQVPGISFLAVYSDMLAWAAVDANSSAKVNYFAALDPKYATTGFDLIANYAALSAADAIVRVFTGLSATSQGYWIFDKVGTWILLLLALIALGKWRLSFFLAVAMLSLAAAASLQFSPRHGLHFIALDRALGIVICAALIEAAWRHMIARRSPNVRLALLSGLGATSLVLVVVTASYFLQSTSTAKLNQKLQALDWYPSPAAYKSAFPGASESILRIVFDGSRCVVGEPKVILNLDGERIVRDIPRLGNTPRPIYFTLFDPTISKTSVELTPPECIAKTAWAFVGDGATPPLQMFDPQDALAVQSLGRLFGLLGRGLR